MRTRPRQLGILGIGAGGAVLTAALLAPAATATVAPGTTERASLDQADGQLAGPSDLMGLSDDGRQVLFRVNALTPDPSSQGLWLRDRLAATTTRVSVTSDGRPFGNPVTTASLAGDGRVVAFIAVADNGSSRKLWVHDRRTGTTERLGAGVSLDLSRSGRFVAFTTSKAVLRGDTNGRVDVYVLDRRSGKTERVSWSSNGGQRGSSSYSPSISADGRFVAYQSRTDRRVTGADRRAYQIYLYDRKQDRTEKVSVRRNGGLGHEPSLSPVVSADGRMVVFSSRDDHLVKADRNTRLDVFARDVRADRTRLVSAAVDGGPGNEFSCLGSTLVPEDCHAISADNRYVAFISGASDLVTVDANGSSADVFVRDLARGTTRLVSMAPDGGPGDRSTWNKVRISADARVVAFSSLAANLVPGDTNGQLDTFVRELSAPGSP